jgi:superfamily II DNA or RNA helicase
MMLREYQVRAIERARDAVRAGARAICIVAPTGAGKTMIGGEICRSAVERGRSVLWLAHRHELVEQARARLTVPAVVATVQGLVASGERPSADVVVLDEAHHHSPGAPAWFRVAESYAGATLLGLTATPERGDGAPLAPPFDAMIVAASYSDLLAAGHLVPAEVWGPPGVLRGGQLACDPIAEWRRRAAGQRTVCYAADIAHAHELAARWRAAGVAAAAIDADTSATARDDALRQWAAGELTVLCNVHLLTEGFDLPAIECVVLARGFSHPGSYIQACGRALRPAPGKSRALVLDLRGSTRVHGLPDADREYSLAGRAIRESTSTREPVRQCSRCGAVFAAPGRICPRCGARVGRPRTIEERRESLALIRTTATPSKHREAWARLQAQGRAAGYKPGWAWCRFRAIYGCAPPR